MDINKSVMPILHEIINKHKCSANVVDKNSTITITLKKRHRISRISSDKPGLIMNALNNARDGAIKWM